MVRSRPITSVPFWVQMTSALVDNDVVLKACCYGLDDAMIAALGGAGVGVPAMLPLARYVVSGRIKRDKLLIRRDVVLAALDRVRATFGVIEPNDEEIHLAASFEATAQARNLELDGGESLLLAILLRRGLRLLLTGDKRAIRAIEQIAADHFQVASVACLEQLMTEIMRHLGVTTLRKHVCTEPTVDRAMTFCFACESPVVDLESVVGGLQSYIADLRKAARRVLIKSDDLSSLIP